MRTIKLTIAYDGTKYKGWQLQKNSNTVQEELEKAIKKVLGKNYRVHGAGRTDSGVHAKAQIAHFKTASKIPVEKFSSALNAILPKDITIKKTEEVKDSFHSRFSSKGKIYEYKILNSKYRNPFMLKYSWQVPYRLDVKLMKREAKYLLGRHDFRSFQASDKKKVSSIRTIKRIDIKKDKDAITINIEGDGFLYNMVRNIVGTLVDVGRGYFPPGNTQEILKAKDRKKAGPTAPAKGLFLTEVKY